MNFKSLNILPQMRLWQKFALLGALGLAAVAVPFYTYFDSKRDGIAFTAIEISGLKPAQAGLRLLQLTQQHRGLSAALLGGNDSQAQARAAKQAEVDQMVSELDRQLAQVEGKKIKDSWADLKKRWRQTATEVANRSVDARKSFDAHTDLVREQLTFLDTLGDHYKLTLDPTAHTYFLVQASLFHQPEVTELMGQLRGLGTARLADAARLRSSNTDAASGVTAVDRVRLRATDAGGAVTGADRSRLTTLLSSLEASAETAGRFVVKAIEAAPHLRAVLEAEAGVPAELTRQMVQLTKRELIDNTSPSYDSATFFRGYTDTIDAQFKFLGKVSETLESELNAYAGQLRRDTLLISAAIVAVLVLVVMIAAFVVRNITSTVQDLQDSVQKVRGGDTAALRAIEAKDEVGDLGRLVNDLLEDQIAAREKAEEERRKAEAENERLNNSVISILQSVHQLSQRDLTAKAPVTEDVIGTVSDSINLLTDETAKVLHGVTRIANQVELVSGKVKSQADLVSKTAADERQDVEHMVTSLTNATQTMNQVAALAEQSNESAEQATRVTETALETVQGTVRGMESIRETISETEKRIKRLGERSQEITGIVNLINTISERTHVLALNASMQAAVAGEAGRGFAVVAEEVQRLAESSRNATQQIGTLVSNIQLETNETIATVNRTIGQVVQGSELAQKAGEQMRHTQQITAQLVQQVQRIAESSDKQKDVSAELLVSVQRIGQSTERTAQQIEAQNLETDTLLQSARRLVESVNVFKLPHAA